MRLAPFSATLNKGDNLMKRIMFWVIAGIVSTAGLTATPATGAMMILADAALTSKPDVDGVHFDYTITLKNTAASTAPIGTFWFSWVPGKDLMTNSPLSETNPSGWTSMVTHGGATDGFAIQWVSGSAASDVAIGSSLTFDFKSTETPAELAGLSHFFPTFPQETATVYQGAPFVGATQQIVVKAVPEPSTLVLSFVGGLAMLVRKRFKRSTAETL